MLSGGKKDDIQDAYRRIWMSDEYFDLILWSDRSKEIHAFQLCYGKPRYERALTWITGRGFSHAAIDSGEGDPRWNRTPVLLAGGSFPAHEVTTEFRNRSVGLPKSLRDFVLMKLTQFDSELKP